jgi:endonuclease YncB( thermonuclease family)
MGICPAVLALSLHLVCAAEVVRVVDGDTAIMRFGDGQHSVRLVGVNSPNRGQPGYIDAKNAAVAAFQGRVVTLTIGGARNRNKGRCSGASVLDFYQRVLATVNGWVAVVSAWEEDPWCR